MAEFKKNPQYSDTVLVGATVPARIVFYPRLSAEACKSQVIKGRKADANKNVVEVTVAFAKDGEDSKLHRATVLALARNNLPPGFKVNLSRKAGDTDVFLPFFDGDAGQTVRDHMKGMFYIKMRSSKEPEYFDTRVRNQAGRMVPLTDQDQIDKTFYSGCYVVAKVVYKFSEGTPASGNTPTIVPYLNALVFVRDGERLGRDSAAEFDQIASLQRGQESDYDPLAEVLNDDELPF